MNMSENHESHLFTFVPPCKYGHSLAYVLFMLNGIRSVGIAVGYNQVYPPHGGL